MAEDKKSDKKKKDKKLRRKENREKALKQEKIEFDVLNLLMTQDFETKPKLGDFLKTYVKSIRIFTGDQKLTIYPVFEYYTSKIFIDFLDGHQIIVDVKKSPREYYLYFRYEEIEMKEKEKKSVVSFVQRLQEFSFIPQ